MAVRPDPQVGIVFFSAGQLWFDTTPLSQASTYGKCLGHERGHLYFWEELVRTGVVPASEYEEFPRGRIIYDKGRDHYTIFADSCILERNALVKKIIRELHLPKEKTNTAVDSHYRCFACLRNVCGPTPLP